MKSLKLVLIVAILFLFFAQASLLAKEPVSKISLGEQLERQMWADMKAKNWPAVEKKIASGFQSAHEDGARNRQEEIILIKNLNIGKYTLTEFKVTRNGPTIVVTYFVSVEETIKGKQLSTKPAARLSVWIKTDEGWQWLTHANLNPLKE